MTPKVTKPEMPKIKQEPETECANNTSLADFSAGYVAKRKSGEASGAESPGKKKPKLEKFIVAHAQCENGDRVGGGDMWRQTAPAVARSGAMACAERFLGPIFCLGQGVEGVENSYVSIRFFCPQRRRNRRTPNNFAVRSTGDTRVGHIGVVRGQRSNC